MTQTITGCGGGGTTAAEKTAATAAAPSNAVTTAATAHATAVADQQTGKTDATGAQLTIPTRR